jgi:hypothetical protein
MSLSLSTHPNQYFPARSSHTKNFRRIRISMQLEYWGCPPRQIIATGPAGIPNFQTALATATAEICCCRFWHCMTEFDERTKGLRLPLQGNGRPSALDPPSGEPSFPPAEKFPRSPLGSRLLDPVPHEEIPSPNLQRFRARLFAGGNQPFEHPTAAEESVRIFSTREVCELIREVSSRFGGFDHYHGGEHCGHEPVHIKSTSTPENPEPAAAGTAADPNGFRMTGKKLTLLVQEIIRREIALSAGKHSQLLRLPLSNSPAAVRHAEREELAATFGPDRDILFNFILRSKENASCIAALLNIEGMRRDTESGGPSKESRSALWRAVADRIRKYDGMAQSDPHGGNADYLTRQFTAELCAGLAALQRQSSAQVLLAAINRGNDGVRRG